MVVRYAIIVKPFYFSADTEREIARLSSRCVNGTVYVVVDVSRKVVAQFRDGIRIDLTEDMAISQGYAAYPSGRLFWYNADYPLYCLYDIAPDFDYYLMVEYDAVLNCDLDILVEQAAASGTDLVAQQIETPPAVWRWSDTCRESFPSTELDPRMLCVALFSRRAVEALKTRRLELSAAYNRGEMKKWPIAEAFVGTEMRRQGMNVRDMQHFGRLAHYDVWPPVHAWQLPFMTKQAVVHPVLRGRRYWAALLRNGVIPAIRAQLGMLSDVDTAYRHVWTARGGSGKSLANTLVAGTMGGLPMPDGPGPRGGKP